MPIDFSGLVHAVESVVTFALIGALGYFLAMRNWFTRESNLLITKLITLVALPVYLLYNVNDGLTKDQLAHLAYGLIIPYVSIILLVVIGMGVSRLLKVPRERHGVFCVSCGLSNTMYIGLPVNLALFGEAALPYVLLYYFANSTIFWTMGNYLIASSGEGTTTKIFSMTTVKRVFSMPMIGFLVGLALLLLDIKLPAVIANTAKMLGSITTPLVLISIGVTLYDMGLSKIRPTLQLAYVMFSRFILSALLIIALSHFLPLPDMMRKIFIIQATLPVMSTTAMLASFYKSDPDFAAVSVSATTIMGIFTIPLFMIIVSNI